MKVPLFQVDAFADRPFGGNPAAVCLLESAREDDWMQAVAQEMNLAETAFVFPQGKDWSLRWFTPLAEVPLCGHATLATAHILWEQERLAVDEPARFHTKSGLLVAKRVGHEIVMDFPTRKFVPAEPPNGLFESLGAKGGFVTTDGMDSLVELDSEDAVRRLTPNLTALRQVKTRGAIVTARSKDPRFDFVSRFFVPSVGVDEDPVTGSAHCGLTPYWSAKLGKSELVGFQASKRGGIVKVRHRGDRVDLIGKAVTVLRGELIA